MQGRRFLGAHGKEVAAAEIQAAWRMHVERTKYLEYRKKKWAAGVIAISWIMHIKMVKVRHQLKQTRLDQIESFKIRSKVLMIDNNITTSIFFYACSNQILLA